MNITSISDFRKETKKYFDQIINDQNPLLITRSDGETVVAIPLSEYNGLTETEHLRRSPAMRKRIEQGMAQARKKQAKPVKLEDLEASE